VRLFLVSAGQVSMPPADEAFRSGWPDVKPIHLLDASLSTDGAVLGTTHPEILGRFEQIGRYCERARADAVLFTCSAFAEAIGRVKRAHRFPVLTPNEAMFDRLLDAGGPTAVLVTFPASVEALRSELTAQAAARGIAPQVTFEFVPQAYGSPDHDRLIVEHCERLAPAYRALALGQFSMASAAPAARAACPIPVWDTPGTSVAKLRTVLQDHSGTR